MLTMTIKATTPKAVDRLMKAITSVLTREELKAFQEQIAVELARVAKKKRGKTK